MRRCITIICFLFLFSSCATYSFVKSGTEEAFPPNPEDCKIDILTTLPQRPMVEVGLCFGQTPGGGIITDKTPEAIEQLKKCACANGGDAVLLLTGDQGGVFTDLGYSQQVVRMTGKVYRYK